MQALWLIVAGPAMLPHRPQRAQVYDVASRARAYAGGMWYVVCGVESTGCPASRVGLSEKAARKQGRDFRVANMPMKNALRILETGETRGFTKGIVDADTPHTLGCAIFGLEGGEMMSIIPVATMGKLPYTALKGATFTPPTLAERPNSLFMTLDS